ncbi:MAG: hypothetical protein LBE18_01335 [Planctomycetaceae bacterium]|jgi:hypothetical protein|nr:hypothetical protein [Planctomycetaceae bacterium]
MFRVICSVRDNVSRFYRWITGVASVAILSLFFGGLLYAADDPVEVPVSTPDIDWSSLPASIMGALAQPIAVGIGIAVSIFVVYMAVKLVKRI